MKLNSKSPLASKLNWVGAGTTVFGAYLIQMFNDPVLRPVLEQVKSIIPPTWVPYVTVGIGVTTFVLRTFFTSKPTTLTPAPPGGTGG